MMYALGTLRLLSVSSLIFTALLFDAEIAFLLDSVVKGRHEV